MAKTRCELRQVGSTGKASCHSSCITPSVVHRNSLDSALQRGIFGSCFLSHSSASPAHVPIWKAPSVRPTSSQEPTMPRAASARQVAATKAAPVAEPAQEQPVQQTPQKEQVAEGHSGKAWQVHGGEIRIQIFAPHTTAENEKIIRVSEVHNETQTSVYGSQGEVQQQHAYDTSPHAGEHHAQARSTLIGGTIIIEVHNETSLKVFPPADASASGQQQANDHTLHEGEGNAQVDVVTGHKEKPAIEAGPSHRYSPYARPEGQNAQKEEKQI